MAKELLCFLHHEIGSTNLGKRRQIWILVVVVVVLWKLKIAISLWRSCLAPPYGFPLMLVAWENSAAILRLVSLWCYRMFFWLDLF